MESFFSERFEAVHNEVFDHLEHERSSLKHVKTELSRRNILGHWETFGGQVKFFLEGSGGFVVRFCLMNLHSEGFEVRFLRVWIWVLPVSGLRGSKFGFFWRGSHGFEVRFWWMNLGSSEFEVRNVKYEAV